MEPGGGMPAAQHGCAFRRESAAFQEAIHGPGPVLGRHLIGHDKFHRKYPPVSNLANLRANVPSPTNKGNEEREEVGTLANERATWNLERGTWN